MIKLYLDNTVSKKAKVQIVRDGKVLGEAEGGSPLLVIKDLLTELDIKLEEIDEFSSNPGPGSYTGVRVGAAVINALNFALGKKAKLIEPVYE